MYTRFPPKLKSSALLFPGETKQKWDGCKHHPMCGHCPLPPPKSNEEDYMLGFCPTALCKKEELQFVAKFFVCVPSTVPQGIPDKPNKSGTSNVII